MYSLPASVKHQIVKKDGEKYETRNPPWFRCFQRNTSTKYQAYTRE
jgi:hypothetical protein